MPGWLWFIIVPIGLLIGFFTVYEIWHRSVYKCSMFNDKITTYDDHWLYSGEKKFKTFEETYQRHCSWRGNNFTKDIPFSTFKSLYTVNPDRWLFRKSLCWKESNYFHLEYITEENYKKDSYSWRCPSTIKVIFNKEDFRKFLWFLVEQIEEEKNADKRAAEKQSRDQAQEIINSALNDIRKLEEQAEVERQQVEETAAAVKKNIHAKINERTAKIDYSSWKDKVP